CWGFHPVPWFVVGILIAVVSVLLYALSRRHDQGSAESTPPVDSRAWPSALLWVVGLALAALAALSALSIGLFILPFAFAAIVLAATRNTSRAWPWGLLGLWLLAGILPLVQVRASLNSQSGPFRMSLGTDHLISILFGGSGLVSETGGRGFTGIQRHAIHEAWRMSPAGATVIAMVAVVAFALIRMLTRSGWLAISVGSFLYLIALVVLAFEVEASVRALRPALDGHIRLSYEPTYW